MRLRLQQLNYLLHGDRVRFTVEQRLFNMACLYGFAMGSIFTVFNLSLGLGWSTVSLLAPCSLCFGLIYTVTRFSRPWRDHYYSFAWPAMLLASLALIQLWFANGGSWGGSQYFLFVHMALAVTILRGGHRRFGIAMIVLLAVALLAIEYRHPEWIRDYSSRSQRYFDLFVSMLSGLAAVGLVVATLQVGLRRRIKHAQDDRLLLQEDLTLARTLQRKVFAFPDQLIGGLDFALEHHASGELSGDLYDITRLSSDRVRIFLADARGHGINAALSAMIIKSEWQHIDQSNRAPGEALTALNQLILDRYQDTVSFSATVADLSTERIVFASAGQISVLLADRGRAQDLDHGGPPLGMLESIHYADASIPLLPGARVILMTDGFTDATDFHGQSVGGEWVLKTVETLPAANSKRIARGIVDRFALMIGQSPHGLLPHDDCTMIVVGWPET